MKILAILGFLALALSPSFVDWQESPERRPQMVLYYAVALTLIVFGLDGWTKGA